MSFETGVQRIIRRHMEALHDDLSDVLGDFEAADRTLGGSVDGEEFAAIVGREIRAGLMTTGEYVAWFDEEVGAR
jgi:hypothetical protein